VVLVTTLVGFYLGRRSLDIVLLLNTLLGTALVPPARAPQQYVEPRRTAACCVTRRRPLPAALDPGHALLFAAVISVAGLLHLVLNGHLMTADWPP